MPRINETSPRPKKTLTELMEMIERHGVRSVGDRILLGVWTRKDGVGARKRLAAMAEDTGLPEWMRLVARELSQWRLR